MTVETCVRKARDYLARRGIEGEILVADNGSSDGSTAGARVVEIRHRGYGAAPAGGIEAARGRFDRGDDGAAVGGPQTLSDRSFASFARTRGASRSKSRESRR